MLLPCCTAVPLQAYGQVDEDGSRFLLSDMLGNLYLLLLLRDDGAAGGSAGGGAPGGVTELKLEPLGRTPAASTISYLDSGVVFVGSSLGDSQLIRCAAGGVRCGLLCWLCPGQLRALRNPLGATGAMGAAAAPASPFLTQRQRSWARRPSPC